MSQATRPLRSRISTKTLSRVRLGILSRDRVSRLDPLVTEQSKQRPRRLYHHVFARAGELRDANGVLRVGNGEPLSDRPPRSMAPRRLVESDDPFVRTRPPALSALSVNKPVD